MIKRRKNIKESKVDAVYSEIWEYVLDDALQELEDTHEGNMNGSGQFFFRLTDKYGEELPYEGFAAFDRIEGDSLIMNVVYPNPITLLYVAKKHLEDPEEPDIEIDAIKSEAEKEQALIKMDDYIDALKSDLETLKDWQFSDETIEIAEGMSENGGVDELRIELPDADWVDFDYFTNEKDAILQAMRGSIASELAEYARIASQEADRIISNARTEIEDLIDEISEKLSDAKYKRKEIEELDIEDEEFESVRRRRNLRRVIESRRARAKKESLRRRINRK